MAPISPIVICIATATARLVCAETFSPGQLRKSRSAQGFTDKPETSFALITERFLCIRRHWPNEHQHIARQLFETIKGKLER